MELVMLACLSGNDYSKRIKGWGPSKISALLQQIDLQYDVAITEENALTLLSEVLEQPKMSSYLIKRSDEEEIPLPGIGKFHTNGHFEIYYCIHQP